MRSYGLWTNAVAQTVESKTVRPAVLAVGEPLLNDIAHRGRLPDSIS